MADTRAKCANNGGDRVRVSVLSHNERRVGSVATRES